MKIFVIWLGKAIARISRLAGGAGTTVPGFIIEKFYPRSLKSLSRGLDKVIIITGTNGKTTTTKLVSTILSENNHKVLVNRTGSNLRRGLITSLIEGHDLLGRQLKDIAVFEVDEAAVSVVCPDLGPDTLLVTNLGRDQLDRYGELETVAKSIKAGAQHCQKLVLNGDDPLVSSIGEGHKDAYYFGATDPIKNQLPHDSVMFGGVVDSIESIDKALELVDASNEDDQSQILTIRLRGFEDNKYNFKISIPGIYNAYNAAASVLVARLHGLKMLEVISAIEYVQPAFGRGQIVNYKNKRIQILLAKNPSGMNQVISMLSNKQHKSSILFAINDLTADGHDVSWLWDSDIEKLYEFNKHSLYASGIRAYDMALRLKYAELESIADTDIESALNNFVHSIPDDGIGYIIPNYTAMLTIHKLLNPDKTKKEAWV